MHIGRNIILFVFVVLIAGIANGFAQIRFWDVENEVTQMLLKKDLRQAIKEAESSSASDLKSLLRRLTLYRRAANFEKVALTVRQILDRPDFNETHYQSRDFLEAAMGSEYFRDTKTLQLYIQKVGPVDNIYGKFIKVCTENRAACDVAGFDQWLAQKAAEAEKSSDKSPSEKYEWLFRQIDWRKRFGLDGREISNRFIEDVRRDPADLEAALRYLKIFNSSADALWLAENFASPQAYSYYELGETIGHLPSSFYAPNMDEARQLWRIAVRFLLKSLELPVNEKDAQMMYAYKFRYVSVAPTIKNYEKQIRFWTKEELAENYKNIGEPQSAQPLVEELTKMDKSDIMTGNPAMLAGAVQEASGARAVESEILRQQAQRQDSYEYWRERVAYYQGRKEPELMFSSYMQAFAAVPFDLSKEGTGGWRISFIRWFSDMVEHEFGQNSNQTESEDWSDLDRRRHQFWKDAENFLRAEYEKTKSNIKYSYALSEIIYQNDFDNLASEIVNKNPELLINAARSGLLNSSDHLLSLFLNDEKIPPAKKDLIFNELIKIADNTDVRKAFVLLEAISGVEEAGKYSAKLVPLFEKYFAKSLEFVRTYKRSDDDDGDFKNLPEKYAEILFRGYLLANDRKAAEKILLNGYYSLDYGTTALINNAVRNGAFDDALRYWKMKAASNRQNLSDLSYLRNYPVLAKGLRDFYVQMKIDEPYSPIPDAALQILK